VLAFSVCEAKQRQTNLQFVPVLVSQWASLFTIWLLRHVQFLFGLIHFCLSYTHTMCSLIAIELIGVKVILGLVITKYLSNSNLGWVTSTGKCWRAKLPLRNPRSLIHTTGP
jgi:hypothetical protein